MMFHLVLQQNKPYRNDTILQTDMCMGNNKWKKMGASSVSKMPLWPQDSCQTCQNVASDSLGPWFMNNS